MHLREPFFAGVFSHAAPFGSQKRKHQNTPPLLAGAFCLWGVAGYAVKYVVDLCSGSVFAIMKSAPCEADFCSFYVSC
jgi:hypothetical protein